MTKRTFLIIITFLITNWLRAQNVIPTIPAEQPQESIRKELTKDLISVDWVSWTEPVGKVYYKYPIYKSRDNQHSFILIKEKNEWKLKQLKI